MGQSTSRRTFLKKISLGVAAVGACGPGLVIPRMARAQQPARQLTRVRLTGGANLGYAPHYVGEATDIFRKHGIDGLAILFDVGFLGTEAVIAGHAETAGTVEFPLFNLLLKGADLIIPAIYITADDLKIVTLKSIQKPEDLIGRRVGYIFGSSAHYAFDRYLAKFGVPRDKVKAINVPAAEQVPLMAKGDIEAFIWVEPVVSRGIEVMAGKAQLMSPNIDVVYKTRNYLEMSRSWAEKNPDVVVNLLRALIECNEFIKNEPKRTAEICARKLNLPVEQAPELLRKGSWTWEVYLDAAVIQVFDEVAAWLKEQGRLSGNPPDMRRVFAPEYLRKIDPARVRGF